MQLHWNYCILFLYHYLFYTFIVIKTHTPCKVMFDHKEVLPLDFNSQRSCDPYEALRAFNEIPLTDSVDVQAGRTEMNAMVTTNIEKAPAKQKEQ